MGQVLFEGYGDVANAGGDGQSIVHVTNLNDSGAGSFRSALSAGNRIIVFDVGGDIFLSDFLFGFGANVTINGHTAPAPGITLHNRGLVIRNDFHGCHDWIVRGLRVRDSTIDGIQVTLGAYNVVISHCSTFGSLDGNIDITGLSGSPLVNTHHVTVCWSFLAKGQQVKSSLIAWNTTELTFHHNLFHGGISRNPQVKMDDAGGQCPAGQSNCDVVNTGVWGWKKGVGSYYQKGARGNYRKNIGLATDKGDDRQQLVCESNDGFPLPADKRTFVYSAGNVNLEGYDVDAMGNVGVEQGTPPAMHEDDPLDALRYICAFAGPRFPTRQNPTGLDALDKRLVDEVITELFRRTG